MTKRQQWQTALTIAALVVPLLWYGLWFASERPAYFESAVPAALLAILFFWAYIRLVPKLIDQLCGDELPGRPEAPQGLRSRRPLGLREALIIAVIVLGFRFLVSIVGFLLHYWINGYTATFVSVQRMWGLWSFSQNYLAICESGYTAATASMHLSIGTDYNLGPVYSLVVYIFSFFTKNYIRAGFMVSVLSSVVGAVLLYGLVLVDYDRPTARRAVRYLCLIPASFLFSCTICDSLLFMLSVWVIYLARRRQFLFAGIVAGVAVLTRSSALALVIPLAIEFTGYAVQSARQRRTGGGGKALWTVLQGLGLALPLLCFGLFLLMHYNIYGDMSRVAMLNGSMWVKSVLPFFRTAAYQSDFLITALRSADYKAALGVWLPNLVFIFGALTVTLLCAKKLRPSYSAYMLVSLLSAFGTGWLIIAPRLIAGFFPFIMGLALVSRRRLWDIILSCVCAAGFLLYFYAFVARYGVY